MEQISQYRIKKGLLLLILMLSFSNVVFGQNCAPATPEFCESKKPRIGTICHSASPGALVYFDLADGSCVYCRCSCVASYTPVATGESQWTKMGEIKIGDQILAFDNNSWVQKKVTYSDGTEGSNSTVHFAIFVALSNGSQLVTTPDHIFLMYNRRLKRADRLAPDDILLDDKLRPLKISELYSGDYKGAVHNITAGQSDLQTPNLSGHFINTNNVISGDYYIQTIKKNADDIGLTEPQIGSEEYKNKFKASLKGESMLGITKTVGAIKLNETNLFIPHKSIVIPENAINFLPKEYEQPAPNTLAPLDSSVPYEVAEYIVYNFKRFYPDVIYHVDWSDNTVNAYAWMEGSKRHVAIKGGLIRHTAIQKEAVGLVLAHELGHHYGGGPKYPNNPWASCEGQADYWGALVAERTVWWGPYALEQIRLGSEQLYNLFAYGLLKGNLFVLEDQKSLAGICGHPAAACRLSTYRAALRLDEKPSCAGDPPTSILSFTK